MEMSAEVAELGVLPIPIPEFASGVDAEGGFDKQVFEKLWILPGA